MDSGFLEKEYLMHLCGAGGNGSCAIYLSAPLLLQLPLWCEGSKSTKYFSVFYRILCTDDNIQEPIELYSMECKQPDIGNHLKPDFSNHFPFITEMPLVTKNIII